MAMPGKVPNRTSGAVWGSVSCPRSNADQGKSNQWPPDNMTLAPPLSHKNIRFIAWLAKESEKVEWTRFIKKTQRACNVYTYSGHTESWERCLLCPGSAIINTFTLKLGYRETTIQTLNTCHLRLITACRLKLLCKLQWSKCISLLVISFPSMWLKTAVQHLWKQECSFFAPVTSVSADTPLGGPHRKRMSPCTQMNYWELSSSRIWNGAAPRHLSSGKTSSVRASRDSWKTSGCYRLYCSCSTLQSWNPSSHPQWQCCLALQHCSISGGSSYLLDVQSSISSAHSPLSHTRTPPEWKTAQEKSWLTSPTQVIPFPKSLLPRTHHPSPSFLLPSGHNHHQQRHFNTPPSALP